MRLNISTMRKIAMTSGEWRSPPHFRAPMGERLRAQIRRKWGEPHLHRPS